ncbi:MmgE/PrpD family protein [Pseudonocardia thermophila]|uniref:MmgE/PrpD family protein n=1 Tax=Pseudonocardia thermophila TaxID=1848 RepID=UPI00248E1F0D|nr:MmgE/PrpD family protein [Pseudonocardia thermophila]
MDLQALVHDVTAVVATGVPAAVRHHAGLVLADTVGAMIAGGRAPELAALAATCDPRPQAEVAVPGHPRVGAAAAAAVNAMAGVWLEIDEDSKPGGHVAAQVLPAVLAVAQRDGLSGEQLLRGLVAGYEVAAALYAMYDLRYPVHPHGLFGAVGAAVGAAVARGDDPGPPARIASNLLPVGVWDPCTEGATVRHVLAADAAAMGVRAAELAAAGIGPSATVLDSLTAALGCRVRQANPAHAGHGWRHAQITRNTFKIHSACLHAHAAIEAALAVRRPALDPAEIRSVTVAVMSGAAERIGALPRPNSLSTRFSIPYAVATALLRGEASVTAMGYDAHAFALAEKVRLVVDDSHARAGEPIGGATVTVDTATGTRRARVDRPRGVCDNPVSEEELRAKFVTVVGGAGAEAYFGFLVEVFDAPVVKRVLGHGLSAGPREDRDPLATFGTPRGKKIL